MHIFKLSLDKGIGVLFVGQLGLHQLLGDVYRQRGNLVLQVVHGFQFLVVDALAGIFYDAVGFLGCLGTCILDDFLACHAGVAQHLVALHLGLSQQFLVMSHQVLHFFAGFLCGIQRVCDGLLAFFQRLEQHRPSPLAKNERQNSKRNQHPEECT